MHEAIDCVVVSSLMEGLPNVLLEGLAMKKACVSRTLPVAQSACSTASMVSLAVSRTWLLAAMEKVCAAGRRRRQTRQAGCSL